MTRTARLLSPEWPWTENDQLSSYIIYLVSYYAIKLWQSYKIRIHVSFRKAATGNLFFVSSFFSPLVQIQVEIRDDYNLVYDPMR
jgi:hypothetical protein